MRRLFLLLLCASLLFVSCADPEDADSSGITITDSLGNEATVYSTERIVSLYGSFTESWLLAGGSVVGTTEDAVTERHLVLEDDVTIVGTVKEPNLELILSLAPDFVILSADIAKQASLGATLRKLEIPYGYFRTDTFADYDALMQTFCSLTGRTDLYDTNVTQVGERIQTILASVPQDVQPTVLLLRAFSIGVKAKTDDNFTGMLLKELHTDNIADSQLSLLEDLSLEEIILADPDFIFVTTMGDETSAYTYLAEQLESNPVWSELTAVKNNRYIFLPKDLFHYKPNARWDEAYEYLAKILYPEAFR